jgi:hypothetical protein
VAAAAARLQGTGKIPSLSASMGTVEVRGSILDLKPMLSMMSLGVSPAAGVEAQHACDRIDCLSIVHSFTIATMHSAALLKGMVQLTRLSVVCPPPLPPGRTTEGDDAADKTVLCLSPPCRTTAGDDAAKSGFVPRHHP